LVQAGRRELTDVRAVRVYEREHDRLAPEVGQAELDAAVVDQAELRRRRSVERRAGQLDRRGPQVPEGTDREGQADGHGGQPDDWPARTRPRPTSGHPPPEG